MKKFILEVLFRRRLSANVIQKTDDELTRYLKQKRIISRRREFEQAMSLEQLAKDSRMNTREIRMDHYIGMQNLETEYYDKGRINDNELEYDFLH